jgi:Uma2 family endonuclease
MTVAPPTSDLLDPAGLEPLQLPWSLHLTPDQFELVCQANPDAVLELASPSDQGPRVLAALRQKMELYRANGALLGWLLIPEQQAVEIWLSDQAEPARLESATQLDGGQQFPGLRIDLAEAWARLVQEYC